MLPLRVVFIFLLLWVGHEVVAKSRRQIVRYPGPSPALQTKSLSGTYATDGNNKTTAEVYGLITLLLLKGFAVFRVKAYNDRVWLDRYRRSYWFGDRYYFMDNQYYLATRDTCKYTMTEDERKNLVYEEDEVPITVIVYQCQRYVEYCCGLDCCRNDDFIKRDRPSHLQQYPWDHEYYSATAPLLPLMAPLFLFPLLR